MSSWPAAAARSRSSNERGVMGNVIRGDTTSRLEKFRFLAIEDEARRIVEGARAEAARILEAAKAEAGKTRDLAARTGASEGREKGMAEGRSEGTKTARVELAGRFKTESAESLKLLTKLLWDVDAARKDLESRVHAELVDLALAAARKVIGARVQIDKEPVQDNLRRAVDLILEKSRLRVRVHPEDRAFLEEMVPELQETFASIETIEFANDPAVGRGGVVVDGLAGRVDTTVEAQLARLEAALLGKSGDGR